MTALARDNVRKPREKSLREFLDAPHPLGSCSPVVGNEHYAYRDRVLLVFDAKQSGIIVPRKGCGQEIGDQGVGVANLQRSQVGVRCLHLVRAADWLAANA